MKAENTVMLAMKSMRTPSPQKKQKLERASREEVHPRKKATPFVNDVIEILAPAWIIPCFILVSIGSLGLVWSRAEEMTNISSTPIPMSINGRRLWIPADLAPTRYANPDEEAKLSPTQSRAIPAVADLKWMGDQDPMNMMQ